ncbi:MAG: tetratricopeptide repeat protein [candidate division KSB1 bacterium]|nr:tetratricopeptide repeat protein [candidate division KSB1 bacterium]
MTTPPHIAQEIIAELEPVLAQHPDSMRFARLADAYIAVGRPDKAVAVCEQGLKYHPRYVTGRLVLARAFIAQREQTKALHALKALLDQDPRHPLAWKCYGDLQHSVGKDEPAELSYAELLNLDPWDEDVRAAYNAMRQHRLSPSEEEAAAPAPSSTAAETPTLSPQPDAVEDRFSYILDDIFHEEQPPPATVEEEETPESEAVDIQEFFWPESEAPETGLEELEPRIEEPPVEPSTSESVSEQLFERVEEPPPVPEALAEEPPAPAPTPQEPTAEEERIVTPTLGEIYAAQGQYAKAISVFTILARKHPDNPRFRERIEQLQRKLDESTGKE